MITGSSRGIGRAIAETLVSEGCSVYLTGRNKNDLQSAQAAMTQEFPMPKIYSAACDFRSAEQVQNLFESIKTKWGHLDILVCNVGNGRSVAPLSETHDEWMAVMEENLFTATNVIQQSLPLLKAAKAPSIVLVSSIAGIEATGAPITYSVAKAGIIALTNNFARPLGKEGIRINAVSPGNILFPGSVWDRKLRTEPERVQKLLDDEVPLGKMGTPSDVAKAVVFLASASMASFITGTNMVVDGGQSRGI